MEKSSEQNPFRTRYYRTANGRRVVQDFIQDRALDEQAAIRAALRDLRQFGYRDSRKIDDGIYEVRAETARAHFRVAFVQVAKRVLLVLDAFDKNDRKMSQTAKARAIQRHRDWLMRAVPRGRR